MKKELINPLVEIPSRALRDLSIFFRVLRKSGQSPESKITVKTILAGYALSFASGALMVDAISKRYSSEPYVAEGLTGIGLMALNVWLMTRTDADTE